jgi:hypothetical protein
MHYARYMDRKDPKREAKPTIKDLYPNLNEEQLKEAEENLERYLKVAWRIFERLENEKQSRSDVKL